MRSRKTTLAAINTHSTSAARHHKFLLNLCLNPLVLVYKHIRPVQLRAPTHLQPRAIPNRAGDPPLPQTLERVRDSTVSKPTPQMFRDRCMVHLL